MKKKICFLIIILLFIIFEISMITISYKNNNVEKIIPNNYIIAFKGETSLKVNTTYIYKVKKKKKTTYKYINTTTAYTGNDSTEITEKITKKGSFKKLKEAIKIAKKNKAYNYVKYEDGNIYTIAEYKEKTK